MLLAAALGLAHLLWLVPAASARSPAREMLAVRASGVHLRQEPSPKATALLKLPKDYPVEVLDRRGHWVKAKLFEDWEGWIASADLTRAQTVVVTAERVGVRQRPSRRARVVIRAKRYVTFRVLGRQGAWLKVRDREGDMGWLPRAVAWGSRL